MLSKAGEQGISLSQSITKHFCLKNFHVFIYMLYQKKKQLRNNLAISKQTTKEINKFPK